MVRWKSGIHRRANSPIYRWVDGRKMFQGWGLNFLCVPSIWDTSNYRCVKAFGTINLVRINK